MNVRYSQQLLKIFRYKPPSSIFSPIRCRRRLCEKVVPFRNVPIKQKPIFHQFVAAVSFVGVLEFLGWKEENRELKKLLSRARRQLEKGNESEAIKLYNEALIMAVNNEDTDHIYSIKEKLAVIAFDLRQYIDAAKLFLEVEKYFSEKGISSNDLKMMYITLRLAEIYDNLKNYVKAEEYYKTCARNIKSKKISPKDTESIEFYLLFLTSRAHYNLNQGNYEKCCKYFEKAYEICSQYKGEMSEQSVMLLQQLGSVYYQKGDLEKAVSNLKKAVELGKHLPGLVQLSNVYITLGNILLKQGLIEEAKNLCNQGLKNATRHKYKEGIKESNACLQEAADAALF